MEQFIVDLSKGLEIALQPINILYIFLGVAWGIIGGALPGVSGIVAMSLVLPFTFGMKPEQGVMILVSVLVGTGFGNGIPAILIRVPGTPAAVLTVVEGFQLKLQGQAAKALGLSLSAAAIGQFLSFLVLVAAVGPLSRFGLQFLSPEIFALVLMAMMAVASLTGKSLLKGLVAAVFGLAISTIGVDPVTGVVRFTFGSVELYQGLEVIPVILGFLAMAEVFYASRQMISWEKVIGKALIEMPSWSDLRYCAKAINIGTIWGIILGALPGAGANIAAFVAYQQTKTFATNPELFGKGSKEGLTTVDASNNAAFGGELIPTLGLGVPGGATMAVVMALLIVHGVQPGPMLMREHPEIVQAVFGGLLVATFAMLILGYLSIRPSVYITSLSSHAVVVGTLVLATVGVYALRWSFFDVWVLWIFGIVGYFMRVYGFSVAAATLGVILGGLMEQHLRRGLLMTDGSILTFVSRPYTALFLLLSVAFLVYPFVVDWRRKRALRQKAGGADPMLCEGRVD